MINISINNQRQTTLSRAQHKIHNNDNNTFILKLYDVHKLFLYLID